MKSWSILELFEKLGKDVSTNKMIEKELKKRAKETFGFKRKLYLTKTNSKKILKPLGFKKRNNERWEFVKNFGEKRIHIKNQKGGFYWHIDNHN